MFFVLFLILGVSHLTYGQNSTESGKVLSVFNVVRFPNDLCDGGSNKNGTCYTTSECSTRGGTSSGTCANGYGVCCVFTLGCGGVSSENSTYFDAPSAISAGQCTATICKVNSDICKLRLDFTTFAINGPSTLIGSDSTIVGGSLASAKGAVTSTGTRCLTDYFSVTGVGSSTPAPICGTNTGTHMFVDARTDCNKLTFHLGTNAFGIAKVDTRNWSIKVTQISCFDPNIPPPGCTQYFYGSNGVGTIQSYNYGATTPFHLAGQHQKICIRRERGFCRMCYYAAAKTDFAISGKVSKSGGFQTKSVSKCCGYGTDGKKSTNGFDCLLVPGAEKTKAGTLLPTSKACGGFFNTKYTKTTKVTAKATSPTVCTRLAPFMVEFITDNYEYIAEKGMKGFKLAYFQDATNCS